MLTRRSFNLGLTSAAFGGLALSGCAGISPVDLIERVPGNRIARMRRFNGYGPLLRDSAEEPLFDLPADFSYRTISWHGVDESQAHQPISGADRVPDKADGMGTFDLGGGRMALVRNHELSAGDIAKGPFPGGTAPRGIGFDSLDGQPLPGGTTTIVYDYVNNRFEEQYLTLAGTIRNCAGGVTPRNSWLTCEEDVSQARNGLGQDHGWVFEVPASARAPIVPRPIKAMGRFEHEAAAVDPDTDIIYMTEDQIDSLFYRFLPRDPSNLLQGGDLQALALAGPAEGIDCRNWSGRELPLGISWPVRWVTLANDDGSFANDDLRDRGYDGGRGATRFASGEGLHHGRDEQGRSEFFFCCTSGGAIRSGQIMRYRPSPHEGKSRSLEESEPGTLEIFLESTDPEAFNYGDNLTVAPNGHLLVCEDPYFGGTRFAPYRAIGELFGARPGAYLRGVTPAGAVYDIAYLHGNSELAGVCLSPDRRTLFVNVMSPARTLAVTGPWAWLPPGEERRVASEPPAGTF